MDLIITHNGIFHADEVFAVAMLRTLFNDTGYMRTRDRETIKQAFLSDPNIAVVDVGETYDPVLNNFDHHQRSFDFLRPEGWKYSSAGLVWAKYGKEICEKFCVSRFPRIEISNYVKIARRIDTKLVAFIDAVDNGATGKLPEGIVTVSAVISSLNRSWIEEDKQDEAFDNALMMAEIILWRFIIGAFGDEAAVQLVEDAITGSENKEIIILEKFVPWQETICAHTEPKLVVFPAAAGTNWMLQTVPVSPGNFQSRVYLPKEWWGLSNEVLENISEVEGSVFCHANGFIGSAKTKEGAIEMAKKALC